LSSIESGQACCLDHFVQMFKSDVTTYINKLVAKRKPRKIAVCMIYFPDESQPGSWADTALGTYTCTYTFHLTWQQCGPACRSRRVYGYFACAGCIFNLSSGCLGYNSKPKQLQATIAKIFEKATCEINIDGCEVS